MSATLVTSCTISRGTEEEIQVQGFTPSLARQLLTGFATLVTAGLPLLFFRWKPAWRLALTCRQESLAIADRVAVRHVESGDETVEPVVEEIVEDCEDVPEEWRRRKARSQTDRTRLIEEGGSHMIVRFFTCRHIRYVWSEEKGCFRAMFGLTGMTGKQLCEQAAGITEERASGLQKVYGSNSISAPVPSCLALLVEEVLNPFYIFQLCSIILWSFDDYVFYAVCIFTISLISAIISLVEMRQQAEMLHGLVAQGVGGGVNVIRGGSENHVEGEMLCPGDVVKIPPQGCVLPCDAVLLTGSAIVNEAMLTGESVPVTKVCLGEEAELGTELYTPDTHRRQTIFAGTEVIQTRYYGNQPVLAMVVRIGFTTAKGELIRSIMFPRPMDFKFYRDSMRFIGLLFVVAGCGMAYCVYMYVEREVIWQMILLRSLDIITIVVPPALPAAMTVGTYYAQARLRKHRIYCLSPARINVCGKLKLVCFDKTGTLTEEGLSLWGVIPCNEAILDQPTSSVQKLDRESMLVSCLAACHSLITIDGQLSGDPLDLKMFEATGWELVEGGSSENENYDQMMPTMVRPKPEPDLEDSWKLALEIGIIRQFTFTSNLARMSVIAKKLRSSQFMVLVKGAPERLEPLCDPKSLPPDFSSQLATLANSGYRVVAVAGKNLQVNFLKVQKITREEAEKDLIFLGFLVMQNTLKPESSGVIQELRSASLRCLMVTGDNLLTAVSVARDCGLVGEGEEAITMSAIKEEDGSQRLHFEAIGGGQEGNRVTKLAITGRTWAIVRQHFPEMVPRVLLRTVVWARMSPDQKAQLVEALQELGYVAAMCGDGANDCGALKAAHVGVSLSEAEASVAAPFTSAVPNISCIPSLVREGRCALVTSFGVFKYMALYSMIQFASVLILYSNKTNLGDTQFLYIDLVITTTIAVLMGRTGPLDKLSCQRPPGSLVTGPTLASILAQVALCFLGQLGAVMYLHLRPWWTPVDPANPEQEITVNFDTTTIFVISAFQYISIATVFSSGPPFRAPLYKNQLYSLALLLLSATTILLVLNPIPVLSNFFSLLLPFPAEPDALPFQWMLLIFIMVNFLANWGVEVAVNSGRWVKRLFHLITMKKGPRNKYKIVQKDLEEEEKQNGQWPRNSLTEGYR